MQSKEEKKKPFHKFSPQNVSYFSLQHLAATMPQLCRLLCRTMSSLIIHSRYVIASYALSFAFCSCVAEMVFPFSLCLTHWLPNIMRVAGPSVHIFAVYRRCTDFHCHVHYVMLCERVIPRNILGVDILIAGGFRLRNFKFSHSPFLTHFQLSFLVAHVWNL